MNIQIVASEAAKSAPPVAVVLWHYTWSVPDFVSGITGIYVVLQMFYLISKWAREHQERKDDSSK